MSTNFQLRVTAAPSLSLFPANLRYLRKRRGLKQEEISAWFNKKANTVGNWENGKTEPSIPELMIISGYFGVNLEELLRSELQPRYFENDRQLALWEAPTEMVPSKMLSGSSGDRLLAGEQLSNVPLPKTEHTSKGQFSGSEEVKGESGDLLPIIDSEERSAKARGTDTGQPAGDALWFMFRELRTVQERLDRLQIAFDQTSSRSIADKSDH